jgi:hypothetical protein
MNRYGNILDDYLDNRLKSDKEFFDLWNGLDEIQRIVLLRGIVKEIELEVFNTYMNFIEKESNKTEILSDEVNNG